jgi:mannose-6-phosphate isomerase-like protein (cupin superfamily)
MTTFSSGGYVLSKGDGEGIWFLGTLMTVKAGREQTRGGFTLIEQISPLGFAAPPHVHDAEEEAFYVLEGQLQVTCGDQTWTVNSGGFVLLPRGIPHAFSVIGGAGAAGAKLLQISSPAGFEQFAAEAGEPAPSLTLPPSGQPNIPKLLAAMTKYGKRMAGAPPAG